MYRLLGEATLATGERMEIGVIRVPDEEWAAQIIPLLGHKREGFQYHIERSVREPLDELETRFYLGTLNGRAITNVMIVGARGVGILGHVYTVPEHRRKGAYRALMGAQMEDIRRAGYRILTLGTGFETHPYWIYHSFGFRSIDGTSGRMKWLVSPTAEEEHFAAAPTTVRPMRWMDWGLLNLLAMLPPEPNEELPRSLTFRLKQQGNAEGPFAHFCQECDRNPSIGAWVLETTRGAVVGWAVVEPDPLALGEHDRLDLFVHPAFRPDAMKLVQAVGPRERSIVAYTSAPVGYRRGLLDEAEFKVVARLRNWFAAGEARRAVTVLENRVGSRLS